MNEILTAEQDAIMMKEILTTERDAVIIEEDFLTDAKVDQIENFSFAVDKDADDESIEEQVLLEMRRLSL